MICSRCDHETEVSAGYYCRACRATYMRKWRQGRRVARLHAIAERLSHVPRETSAELAAASREGRPAPEYRDVAEAG
jgi:hypothetical protein